MNVDNVFLRNKGDIVGYGSYVGAEEHGNPSTKIHGYHLSQFAKRGEQLVAIHSVQIFREFEEREYPYCFKSFEDPPAVLGDLNKTEKAFKQIIAWDRNKLVAAPDHTFEKLGSLPREVSFKSISTIRDRLQPSPKKVRFTETVRDPTRPEPRVNRRKDARNLQKGARAAVSGSSSRLNLPSSASDHAREQTFSSNFTEFMERLDAEVDRLDDNKQKSFERFEESVDQFEDEWELEQARLRKEEEQDNEHGREQNEKTRACEATKRSVSCLSPAERIRRKCAERDAKRRIGLSFSVSDNSHILEGSSSQTQYRTGSRKEGYDSGCNESLEMPEADESLEEDEPRTASLSPDHNNRVTNASRSANRVFTALPGSPTCSKDPDVICPSPPCDFALQTKPKTRRYRFHKRKPARAKPPTALEKKRLALWNLSFQSNPFEAITECCNGECFSAVNSEYAVVQYRRFLRMNREERKRALRYMYNFDEREWWFDGSTVCSRFVCALSFSNQLQSAVKGTPKARASASVVACPRDNRKEHMKDKIINFLRKLAGAIGDSLPTKKHINLPLLARFQVYHRFLRTLDRRETIPSLSYFCSVWKKCCNHIKTHRNHGFTVCSICERLRSALAKCENEEMQALIRSQMEEHYALMEEERRGYAVRIEMTMKFPSKYLSLIVDGADQKSYGLPHFLFDTKDDQGHKLKVKCIGVLEHGVHKHLSLFTMTEEFDSGANHVLEAVHRVLERKKADHGRLPEVLFVQADNCTRENKNHYFLAYFQLLVASAVFREVQISFLPIGHTHADIDQAFSTVASRLRLFDAITMENLLHELNNCYTPRASAEEMDRVANFSGLCQQSRCLFKVQGFSQYRFFRFSRKKSSVLRHTDDSSPSGMVGALFPTTCDVKIQSQDEWCPMDNSQERKGFLKFVPDLLDTPPTDTTPPENVLEVNKHLQSVEGRVETEENMKQLEALRDKVYTRRIDNFHWDRDSMFELNGDYQGICDDQQTSGGSEHHEDEHRIENVGYALNSFLAIKTDSQVEDPFWVARTLRVEKRDEGGHVTHLKVRWYQLRKESEDPFSGRYEMSTYVTGKKRVFYDDTVDVRTIICQFEALSQKGGLHVRTQKAIRQCLNMN